MRLIDADELHNAMESVTNDPTCPLHLAAEIDEIIDYAHTVGGWISCSKQLPEDGQKILISVKLASGESVQFDTCIEDGGYLYLECGYSFGREVTHWMPLPEPPKEVDEDVDKNSL